MLRAALADRQRLLLENLTLRQQVALLLRGMTRPRLEDKAHICWVGMMRLLDTWRQTVLIVKPESVVHWHRRGWRRYRRQRSKPRRIGRPPSGWDLIHLIRRQSRENPLWGAPRIAAELAVLGHEVAESTAAQSMLRHRPPGKGQRWVTFMVNHMDTTIACDFYTVPTVTFRSLFVFVVLHHAARRILHVGVTAHPTAEIVTLKASPWCNGFCERVIGTLRRECSDHLIPLGERHLTRALRDFVEYDNSGRCHQRLARNAPVPRRRSSREDGEVQARPVLGGLQHVCSRAA